MEILFEEVETDAGLSLRISIENMPDDMSDELIFSWAVMRLCQAFVVCHPDRIASLKKVLDITLQMDREILN